MSLRLIFGRAGSGKSHYCLEEIKKNIEAGGDAPLILIVPEQFTLQAERNLVRAAGGGIMRAEVLSFGRLAYRIFNEVGGAARRHLNSAGKSMLLKSIMDVLGKDFKVLARASRQQGFANVLSEIISEFKRYNITPGLLDTVLDGMGSGDPLKDKLSELSLIYREFEERISSNYMDTDDDLTELSKSLFKSRYLEGARVWIDEFSGFTPQEHIVVEELLKKAECVSVCLCTDSLPEDLQTGSTDVFAPVRHTAAKLVKAARDMRLQILPHIMLEDGETGLGRFRASRELKHLEKHLFSYPFVPYTANTENLRLFTAANPYSEVEETARDIIRLCRDGGARYRDISVVTGNLEAYEKFIGVIFREYGIPYFIDKKRDINEHPITRLILSAFEIHTGNWSYDAVFRYLKTGLSNLEQPEIDLLENYVLAYGIRGHRWLREEPWSWGAEENRDEGAESPLEKINTIRWSAAGPLIHFRESIKGRKNARQLCTALYELLVETGVPDRIEKLTGELKNAGELDLALEYSQIWNIVMAVLDQVVEVLDGEEISAESFSRLLAAGFGECKVGLVPLGLDRVLVGNVERSRSHEINALYILGVNDGIFPALLNNEGLLTDRDRDIMRRLGVELAQDTRTRAFEEQFLVYTALTTAGSYLRLSYSAADHEGRTLRPSIIISRLKRLFPNIRSDSDITGVVSKDLPVMEQLFAPLPAFNTLVSAVRGIMDGEAGSPEWQEVYRWFSSSPAWHDRCAVIASAAGYKNVPGVIGGERIRRLYGTQLYTSVSRLERFAACPFSYFLQYGLKAADRRIFKLEAPDIGVFLHKVIDSFSNRLEELKLGWRELDRQLCNEEASKIIDQLLEGMPDSVMTSSKRYRYLCERLKRLAATALWLISRHIAMGGFEPLGYEIGFGEDQAFPPIEIELPDGEVIRLTGRIDRADIFKGEDGTYLRIIDYKSGSKAFRLSDVYFGLSLQLMTYMGAIAGSTGGNIPGPLIPGGVLYFKLDDPIIPGNRLQSEEEIEKALMKQLKMKGLLLADVRLIKEMDRNIDGSSLIIPARINKGDVLGRSSAATLTQFSLLSRHVKRLLSNIGEEMLKGNVSISPYKKKDLTSCAYCSYMPVCQFDPLLKENKYRVLKDFGDDEVWNRLGAEIHE